MLRTAFYHKENLPEGMVMGWNRVTCGGWSTRDGNGVPHRKPEVASWQSSYQTIVHLRIVQELHQYRQDKYDE